MQHHCKSSSSCEAKWSVSPGPSKLQKLYRARNFLGFGFKVSGDILFGFLLKFAWISAEIRCEHGPILQPGFWQLFGVPRPHPPCEWLGGLKYGLPFFSFLGLLFKLALERLGFRSAQFLQLPCFTGSLGW